MIDGGEWSISRLGCLTPEKEPRYPLNRLYCNKRIALDSITNMILVPPGRSETVFVFTRRKMDVFEEHCLVSSTHIRKCAHNFTLVISKTANKKKSSILLKRFLFSSASPVRNIFRSD